MKHRFICTLTVLLFGLSGLFTGCATQSESTDSDKLSIVTTCFPPYDFAKAVTGDTADITMLLCPGAEAHSYEPSPLDIVTIQQCDVFIYIGGTGEVWAEKILETVGNDDMTVIRLMDFVELLEEEEVAGASPNGHDHHHHHEDEEDAHNAHSEEESDNHNHDNDEEEHSDEGHYDEHIWTSPKNAKLCVQGIADALCDSIPEYVSFDWESYYNTHAAAYINQLELLDKDFTEMTQNAPENTIIIGDRFPFRYLAHDYGLEYFAAFSGCSSESEPGVYTMAYLIDEIKAHNADNVFYLEFSTKRLAEKLSDATDAEMLPLHSCHNVSQDDFDSGVTYLNLMQQNLNNLREALY